MDKKFKNRGEQILFVWGLFVDFLVRVGNDNELQVANLEYLRVPVTVTSLSTLLHVALQKHRREIESRDLHACITQILLYGDITRIEDTVAILSYLEEKPELAARFWKYVDILSRLVTE